MHPCSSCCGTEDFWIPPDAIHERPEYIMNTDRLKKFLGDSYERVIQHTIEDAFADSFRRS